MTLLALPYINHNRFHHKPESLTGGARISSHPVTYGIFEALPFVPNKGSGDRAAMNIITGTPSTSQSETWRGSNYLNTNPPGTAVNGLRKSPYGWGLNLNGLTEAPNSTSRDINVFTQASGGTGFSVSAVFYLREPITNYGTWIEGVRNDDGPVIGWQNSPARLINRIGASVTSTGEAQRYVGVASIVCTSDMASAGNVVTNTVYYQNGKRILSEQATGGTLQATLRTGGWQLGSIFYLDLNTNEEWWLSHVFWDRALSQDEAELVAAHPFVVYEPTSTRVYSFPSAAAVSTPGVQIFITK